MRKMLVSSALFALTLGAGVAGAGALTVSPASLNPGGTACPFDATTCVPAPPETTPSTTRPRPPQPPRGTGLQVCTVYSNGSVVCEPIAPLQG